MARNIYRFGNCELDPASREVIRFGKRVPLPPKSFECIVYLLENHERAIGKDELISAVWGRVDVSDAVLSQTLLRARRAINDTGERQSRIRTLPRFGYQWVGDFETVEVAAEPQLEETAATNGTDHRQGRRRSWPAAVLVALLVFAGSWYLIQTRRPGDVPPVADSGLAVVLPVEVSPDSPEFAWVRLGAMDFIASRLRQSTALTVLPSEQALRLAGEFADMDGDERIRRVRDTARAGYVVQPFAFLEEGGWRVRLQLVTGEETREFEARSDTPLTAGAVVSEMLLRRLGFDAAEAPAPTALTERLQQVDAELLAGQLATARSLIFAAPPEQLENPRLRVRQGKLEFRAGRIDIAADLFSELLDNASALDPEVRAQALMGLGAVALRQREFTTSEQRYDEAVGVLAGSEPGTDDPALVGNAYNGRGVSRVELGRMEEGIADLGRARIAMARAGDEVEAASVGANIGILEARRGHGERALQEFDRAIDTFERFGVLDNLAAVLLSKAGAELRLLLPGPALQHSRRAMALAEDLENPRLLGAIRQVHVDALLANGLLEEAGSWLDRIESGVEHRRLRWLLERDAFDAARNEAAGLDPDAGDGELALLVVQAAIHAGDPELLSAWLPPMDPAPDGFEARFALALAAASGGAGSEDVMARFEAALESAALQRFPDLEVRAASAYVTHLVADGKPDRASAVLGSISLYVDRDYRAARAALALYDALDDETLGLATAITGRRLAGERDPSRPVIY